MRFFRKSALLPGSPPKAPSPPPARRLKRDTSFAIASLPNELLALILEHSVISTPYSWWLLRLTLVCQRWRAILDTTPGIWRFLILTPGDTLETCQRVFDQSPQSPVGVEFSNIGYGSGRLDAPIFDNLLASRSQNWETFVLYQYPFSDLICEALSRAVKLQRLEVNSPTWGPFGQILDVPGQATVIDVPEEAPLREVSLAGATLRWSACTPIGLKSLELCGHASLPTCSQLLVMLGSSPSLAHIHLGGNHRTDLDGLHAALADLPILDVSEQLLSVTILPELKSLHICNLSSHYIVPLLSRIDIPAVTSLVIQGDTPEIFDPSLGLASFRHAIARLLDDVSELTVDYAMCHGDLRIASFQLWGYCNRRHLCPHSVGGYSSWPKTGIHLSIGGITENNWESLCSFICKSKIPPPMAVSLMFRLYEDEAQVADLNTLSSISLLRGLPHTESLTVSARSGDLITMLRGLAGDAGPVILCPKLSKLDVVTRHRSSRRNKRVTERQAELCAAFEAFVKRRREAHRKDPSVGKLHSIHTAPEVASKLRRRWSFRGIEVNISGHYFERYYTFDTHWYTQTLWAIRNAIQL